MATDDDDAATLRERVRELEATVAQQQDTIEQLMPSRRAILAGGAGLVGGAALTGQASAQSAAGQVGTSSEPVDVEAASVTADSVDAGSVNTGKIATTRRHQDVTSSRQLGNTYTNNTGSDIFVYTVLIVDSAGFVSTTATSGGADLDRKQGDFGVSDNIALTFFVAAGQDYGVNDFSAADISIRYWTEFKPE